MKKGYAVVVLLITMLCLVTYSYGMDETELKHPVKPFLWKLEGDRIGDGVYLFGTVHFSDPRVVTLHPAVEKVFTAAQRVYTESNLTDRGVAEIRKYSTRKSGKKLSEVLGDELSALADLEIKKLSDKRSLSDLEDRKTWALWSTLNHLVNCGDGKVQLDTSLSDRAYEDNKTVIALETLEDQLGVLNRLPERDQKAMVRGYIQQLQAAREKNIHPSQAIFSAYLKGEEEAMIRSVHSLGASNKAPSTLEKMLKKGLIDDRNKRLAYSIEINALKYPNKKHFFAIGITHYIGKNSIIDILKKKGYNIQRIYN